jgi:hypothetical protein
MGTNVERANMTATINAFEAALTAFEWANAAIIADPLVAANLGAMRAQFTEIQRLNGEINGTGHTEANIRALRHAVRHFGRMIDAVSASIDDVGVRNNFIHTVRTQYSDGFRIQINDMQMGWEGMKAASSTLKSRALGNAVTRRWNKIMPKNPLKKTGMTLLLAAGIAGTGVAVKKWFIDEQTISASPTSHLTNREAIENTKAQPKLAELLDRFTVGGWIESAKEQKFDNLFEALQSKTSIMGEIVTLDHKEAVRHFVWGDERDNRTLIYDGKPAIIEVFLTANKEGWLNGAKKYIVITRKATGIGNTDPADNKVLFEKKVFLRMDTDGHIDRAYNSSDESAFSGNLSAADLQTELDATKRFFPE